MKLKSLPLRKIQERYQNRVGFGAVTLSGTGNRSWQFRRRFFGTKQQISVQKLLPSILDRFPIVVN